LGFGLANGEPTMPAELACEWADAFLAPVLQDTPLFTGTAETATINTVFYYYLHMN
jgi:hypothetical protein